MMVTVMTGAIMMPMTTLTMTSMTTVMTRTTTMKMTSMTIVMTRTTTMKITSMTSMTIVMTTVMTTMTMIIAMIIGSSKQASAATKFNKVGCFKAFEYNNIPSML